MDIKQLLSFIIQNNASDLHIAVGSYPIMRHDGVLQPLKNNPIITPEMAESVIYSICTPALKELLLTNKEVDFSYELQGQGRFRVNAFYQKGTLAAAFRYISTKIRMIEELGLPKIVGNIADLPQGLVLITGPVGHGKSTTKSAINDKINHEKEDHIVTVEDPIEYLFTSDRSLIAQREMHNDTHSWQIALRSALREDIDVVLIGEMRDHETMAAALTIAETGHLVLATLHTNSAAQTVDRVIDSFPENQQNQIRSQLSNVLEAVVSQRLLRGIPEGRHPAVEIMFANPAIRSLIRESKTHMIDNVIATSSDLGMQTLETSLAALVISGKVKLEEALASTLRPNELIRQVKRVI